MFLQTISKVLTGGFTRLRQIYTFFVVALCKLWKTLPQDTKIYTVLHTEQSVSLCKTMPNQEISSLFLRLAVGLNPTLLLLHGRYNKCFVTGLRVNTFCKLSPMPRCLMQKSFWQKLNTTLSIMIFLGGYSPDFFQRA